MANTERQKKILFLTIGDTYKSGAFKSMINILGELKQEGYTPIVVFCKKNREASALEEKGIKCYKVRSYSWIVDKKAHKYGIKRCAFEIKKILNQFAIKRICKIICEEKIDLVHINTIGTYVGANAAIKCKIPYVWHIRELLEEDYNSKMIDGGYSLVSKADRIIVISRVVQEKYEKHIGKSKMTVISNGIPVEEYYNPDHEILKKKEITLICVGNMTANKGQDTVLQAVKKLKESGAAGFKVHFWGNGSREQIYKETTAELQIEDFVQFHDATKDIKSVYDGADVFIMSSKCEAFGRVTVEAMMNGCLVVGSNSGCTPEILDNGKYGILYENENSDDLAEKLRGIICRNNDGKYEQMAKEGKLMAIERYDIKRTVSKVIEVYDDIFKSRVGEY